MDRVQVDILGLSTHSAGGGAYALILKERDGSRRLPIIIGAFEAQAIALEIEGIRPPRPMTHDLLKSVIETLGCTVNDVTITELREGTFYARIAVEGAIVHDIDARPSDAIAVAVRFGVPLYISEDVLQEAAFVPDDDAEEGEDAPATARDVIQTAEQQLEALQQQLQEAIAREDYEAAARLRDELRRLQAGQ